MSSANYINIGFSFGNFNRIKQLDVRAYMGHIDAVFKLSKLFIIFMYDNFFIWSSYFQVFLN